MLIMVACTKEQTQPEQAPFEGQSIDVPLKINVSSIQSADPTTRTVPTTLNTTDGSGAKIKTLWYLQFDGTAGDSKLVGTPHFLSAPLGTYLNSTSSIKLVSSGAASHRILWVANMPQGQNYKWDSPMTLTLGQAENLLYDLRNESHSWTNLDNENFVMMDAKTDGVIGANGTIAPIFKRSVAKLSLNVTGIATGIEIVSVRLCNVASLVHVFESNFTPTGVYPVGGTTIDYPNAPDSEVTTVNNTQSGTFSWYVPRNQQGTVTGVTTAGDKTKCAPINATYFEVVVKNTAGVSGIFRVYPGADITTDFNVVPNNHYTATLNIAGVGVGASDSRVENFGDVSFNTLAGQKSNSFILNPPPTGSRKYTIPVTQVNRYWSNTGINPTAGYGPVANKLGPSDQWNVSLVWSDSQDVFSRTGVAGRVQLATSSGTGPDATFEINVPAGVPAGNFTIQIAKADAPGVLWSWHFWVTDYNPDAYAVTPRAGVYTYPVSGGQIERYAGALWNAGGIYATKFMMDRPLGAIETYTTKPAQANDRGILHYQYGRKDPFPAATPPDGQIVLRTDSYPTVPISASVNNPNLFYNSTSSGNWANEATGATYLWNDPLVTPIANGGKSIYDPCPVGWKLPISGTWSDFNTTATTQIAARDLRWAYGQGIGSVYASFVGLRYWPGTPTDPVTGRIWYAPMGYRSGGDGTILTSGSQVYNHSSTPHLNGAQSYGLQSYSGGVGVAALTRYNAFTAHCIQE